MMTEALDTLHFLRPYWLLALIVVAGLTWMLYRRRLVSRSWQAIIDPHLLPHILVQQGTAQRRLWPYILLFLMGSALVLAVAGPAFKKIPQPVFRTEQSLVIVLDLSRSMDAADIKPSRLTRARHKIIDVLNRRKEGQTALVVYAGDAFVVSPLTQDSNTIAALVSSLTTDIMPIQGSHLVAAINAAGDLLRQAGAKDGHILLVTDGIAGKDTGIETSIDKLTTNGYRLSTLGIGTEEGAPIPLKGGGFLKDHNGDIVIPRLEQWGLKKLATRGRGRYSLFSSDDSDIDYLLPGISMAGMDRRLSDSIQAMDLKTDQWREEGPWLLLLVLPFAALAFRRGWLAVILIFLLPVPPQVHAFEWGDLWQNANQQGAKAFAGGNHGRAVELFKSKNWKAAAYYRNKDYERAIEQLKGLEAPDAYYNKGNALAKLGKMQEAIEAYDQALKISPEHEDAKYNRELLKKHLEKQRQQQSQEQKQQSQNSEQNNDQKKGDQQQNEGEQQAQNADKNVEQGDNKGQKEQDAQSNQDDNQLAEAEKKKQQAKTAQNAKDKAQAHQISEPDTGQEKNTPQPVDATNSEVDQANEQWLRRIPDDPGGLLRRKFLYQSQLNRKRGLKQVPKW